MTSPCALRSQSPRKSRSQSPQSPRKSRSRSPPKTRPTTQDTLPGVILGLQEYGRGSDDDANDDETPVHHTLVEPIFREWTERNNRDQFRMLTWNGVTKDYNPLSISSKHVGRSTK
jgi:hypothetical protein